MSLTKCPFCTFALTLGGVWERHHKVRAHVEEKHPEEAKTMRSREAYIRREISTLYGQFGEATLRRY